MTKQPDYLRLTIWEQQPMISFPTQRRWSAPVLPTAGLIQPGYTDLEHRPPRPLRAPAYPLSSRPFLDQETPAMRNSSNHTPPQQTPNRRPRLWARARRLSRLSRLSRRGNTEAQASSSISPSPPSTVQPQKPSHSAFSALENPRPAPPPPATPPSSLGSVLSNLSVLIHHAHAHVHAPTNRRPLSVPTPLRDASAFSADAAARCHRPSSLQLPRFALCSACSRILNCIVGIGAGRVLCTECLRQHFIDHQE